MLTGIWKDIEIYCANEHSELIKLEPRQGPLSLFYACPKYYEENGTELEHKCDNRMCINPEHLETGSFAENSKDMVERGRSCKGSKNGKAKLTDSDIEKILRARELDLQETEIAYIFGVNRVQINRILNNGW